MRNLSVHLSNWYLLHSPPDSHNARRNRKASFFLSVFIDNMYASARRNVKLNLRSAKASFSLPLTDL